VNGTAGDPRGDGRNLNHLDELGFFYGCLLKLGLKLTSEIICLRLQRKFLRCKNFLRMRRCLTILMPTFTSLLS